MKIRLISTSASRSSIQISVEGTSYIVELNGERVAKFSNKLKPEVIRERLTTKKLSKTIIDSIFRQMERMSKDASREVKADPKNPESSATKKQMFSDATVKKVAKEFKVPVATLAQLTKEQLESALNLAHRQLGTAVRNFIRTETKEKIAGNPVTLDDQWKNVIKRAIALKLYDKNDVDVYQLASLTGTKVKELDMVVFKDAETVKKLGSAISKSLNKTFGTGITVSPRVRQGFSPERNIPVHKYNWFRIELPNNISTLRGLKLIDVYVGKGIIYITEPDKNMNRSVNKVDMVKSTASEIVTLITKHIKVKTSTMEKPKAAAKFNEASQYVVDTFGKDLKAKGIELIPTKGGINFYHPRRGVIKAQFAVKNGKMMRIEEFKASFGEVFDVSKRITKPLINKIVKPLLK